MVQSTLAFLAALAFVLPATQAIFPVESDRYLTSDDSYRVLNADVDFDSLLQERTSSSSYAAVPLIKNSVSAYSNSSSSQNETVLNLAPGISVLQTDDNNECYFVETIIGQNPFPLILDTGSAYLWVYGEDCTDSACEDNKLYSGPASASASLSTQSNTPTSTFALAYVTGSAVGEVVEDNIIVNKLATTQKFKFGMAKTVPDFFGKYPVSGVFGLPSNDSSAIESIISALYDSNAISVKRFSISVGQINPNDDYPNAGIFAIGEPISELYVGDIHNVPLIQNPASYWMVSIDKVKVNEVSVPFTEARETNGQNSTIARSAIVDSGTTVLALPKQDAIDLHAYFENSITDGTNFAILCNSTQQIFLELNGKFYGIGAEMYLGPAYPLDEGYDGYCVSNIQGVKSDYWILGAVFLKTVYADFNVENQEIGFAQRNSDVILASTSTDSSSATVTSLASTASGSNTSTVAHTSTNANNGGADLNAGFSLFGIVSSIVAVLLL